MAFLLLRPMLRPGGYPNGRCARAFRMEGGRRRRYFGLMADETIILWRPVGPDELRLIEESGMRAFPPRLAGQPIFYPVLSEEYAVKIACDWNVPASGAGFVTRFRVRKAFLDGYEVQEAGGRAHREYWISAERLDEFNAAIVGGIEVVQAFRGEGEGAD